MKKILLTSILLAFASSSSAALITTDWKSENDNRVVFDENTGLEWLRLSQSDGMKIEDVQALLSTTYEGFRIATTEEVSGLIFDNYDHFTYPYNKNLNAYNSTKSLITLLGVNTKYWTTSNRVVYSGKPGTQTQYEHHAAIGVYDSERDTYGYAKLGNQKITIRFDEGGSSTRYSTSFNATAGSLGSFYDDPDALNVFLVSDGGETYSSINDPYVQDIQSSFHVPVGSATALLSIGLLGLRRKTKNK